MKIFTWKRTKWKILKTEKIITEVGNIGNGFNSKLGITEDKLSDMKDGSIKNIQKYEDEKTGNTANTIKYMKTVKGFICLYLMF